LAKNTGNAGKFHKLPNGAFGLRSWYDDDFLAKASAGSAEVAAKKTRKAKAKARAAKTAKAALTTGRTEAKPSLVKPKAPKKVKDQTIPGSTVQQEEKTA
jgi:DNA-directed RNA polymerase delta subunit